MKYVKFLLAFTVAAIVAAPVLAQDPKFSFEGVADVNYGFEKQTKNDSGDKTTVSGLDKSSDGEFNLRALVEAGKLTGEIDYYADVTGNEAAVSIDSFWLEYTFAEGTALKYDATGDQARYCAFEGDNDDSFLGKGVSSVDITMSGLFLTVVTSKTVDEDADEVDPETAPAFVNGYENTDLRSVPLLFAGYTGAMGEELEFTVGGLFDKYKGKTAAAKYDYTGWMAFGHVNYKLGEEDFAAFDAIYGVNCMFATGYATGNDGFDYSVFTSEGEVVNDPTKDDSLMGAQVEVSMMGISARAYLMKGVVDKDAAEIEFTDIYADLSYGVSVSEQITVTPELAYFSYSDEDASKAEYKKSTIKPILSFDYAVDEQLTLGAEASYAMVSEDDGSGKMKTNTIGGNVNAIFTF